ncbi:hypothetical protein OQA88_8502 [Cercophora sp. LCS_1]
MGIFSYLSGKGSRSKRYDTSRNSRNTTGSSRTPLNLLGLEREEKILEASLDGYIEGFWNGVYDKILGRDNSYSRRTHDSNGRNQFPRRRYGEHQSWAGSGIHAQRHMPPHYEQQIPPSDYHYQPPLQPQYVDQRAEEHGRWVGCDPEYVTGHEDHQGRQFRDRTWN